MILSKLKSSVKSMILHLGYDVSRIKNINGKNKVSGIKEFVKYKIGKNPVMKEEVKAAISLLVIFLPIKNEVMVKDAMKMLGNIFAINSKGRIKLNNAIR